MRIPLLSVVLFLACKPTPDEAIPTPSTVVPDDDLTGLEGLPCAEQEQCAPDGADWLGTTCCAYGDNLLLEGFAWLNETVDVIANEEFVVGCSGFGAAFGHHGGEGADFLLRQLPNPRCQRMAFGPTIGDSQIAYLAHHGDSWVPEPALWSVLLHRDGSFDLVGDPQNGALFEGMTWRGDHLYVAAHDGGLLTYQTSADGSPALLHTLDGFGNAYDLITSDTHAYVIDADQLHVIDLSNPAAPTRLSTFELLDNGRDIDRVGDLLYVAEGTAGVEVIDISTPDAPHSLELVRLDGSVQSVKASESLIATSNWTHVSILDPDTHQRIGTERLVPNFEQDLGVAVTDDLVFVGEWGGISALRYRPGFVAPDIWIEEEIFTVPAEEPATVEIRVKNRGPLILSLDQIETELPFSMANPPSFIPPFGEATLELIYNPSGPSEGRQHLTIHTNDPDELQNPVIKQTLAQATAGLDVGDPVPEELLAFLTPDGAHEGQVLVLAYFALF